MNSISYKLINYYYFGSVNINKYRSFIRKKSQVCNLISLDNLIGRINKHPVLLLLIRFAGKKNLTEERNRTFFFSIDIDLYIVKRELSSNLNLIVNIKGLVETKVLLRILKLRCKRFNLDSVYLLIFNVASNVVYCIKGEHVHKCTVPLIAQSGE